MKEEDTGQSEAEDFSLIYTKGLAMVMGRIMYFVEYSPVFFSVFTLGSIGDSMTEGRGVQAANKRRFE
jgi:hypothetical protein